MLFEHPTIYLGPGGGTTGAVLARGGRVVAVGEAAREKREAGERVVEPEAACLFPGLADAHCHLWGLGRRAGSLELGGADSWSEVWARLREIEPGDLPAGWVIGRGWDEHDWGDLRGAESFDWRGELDEVFPDTPVCLHRVDHHAVAANTEALRRAGYLAGAERSSGRTASRQAEGGRVVRDASGRPTGLLIDEAMDPVLEAIPPAGLDEDRRMFREAADRYLDLGITCAHIAWSELDHIEMLREMHAAGELPLRLHVNADGEDERLPELLAEGPIEDPACELAVRAVKFFADGALGSKGALLIDGYRDGSEGMEVTPPGRLRDRARDLMASGWQVATHAIGDRAARHVLGAYEAAPAEARERLRPRLEHAQMMTDADIARLGELSTVASIQPIHLHSDAAWADEVLSDEQLDRLFPWKRQLAHTTLAAGSDFPIEDPNPWHGIATAVSRRTADGGVFRPDDALSREEILAAYTTGAAHAAGWEERLGQLRPGFAADLIALDRDPFEEPPESIWETDVLATWPAAGS